MSRREGACNRTGEPSVPFCGKGGARERADGFFFAKGKKEVRAKRTLLRRGRGGQFRSQTVWQYHKREGACVGERSIARAKPWQANEFAPQTRPIAAGGIWPRQMPLHQKKKAPSRVPFSFGGPEGIRTLGLCDANAALSPAKLRAHDAAVNCVLYYSRIPAKMQEVRRKKHRPRHFPEDGVTQAENSRKLGEGIFTRGGSSATQWPPGHRRRCPPAGPPHCGATLGWWAP